MSLLDQETFEAIWGLLTNSALEKRCRREDYTSAWVLGNCRLNIEVVLVPTTTVQQLPFPKLYRDAASNNRNNYTPVSYAITADSCGPLAKE
jgi:hypothetical protein